MICAKFSENSETFKNNILTALYNSGKVQEKIRGILNRNHINRETYIHEDLLQEVFFHLSRKSAEEIIEMYEDNPSRLLGLAVTIAVLKGVSSNPKDREYNKHSLLKYILFTSNLKTLHRISSTDDNEEENSFLNVIAAKENEESDDELWEGIRKNLPHSQLPILEKYLSNTKKKVGRRKKDENLEYNNLLNHLFDAIQATKIKI